MQAIPSKASTPWPMKSFALLRFHLTVEKREECWERRRWKSDAARLAAGTLSGRGLSWWGTGSSGVQPLGANWPILGQGWGHFDLGRAVWVKVSNMFYLVIVAVILCILFKILNVNNSAEKSIFYCKNQKFLEEFLKRAPELELPYVPTRFWGFSGHIQTIIQVSTHFQHSCFIWYISPKSVINRLCWYYICNWIGKWKVESDFLALWNTTRCDITQYLHVKRPQVPFPFKEVFLCRISLNFGRMLGGWGLNRSFVHCKMFGTTINILG